MVFFKNRIFIENLLWLPGKVRNILPVLQRYLCLLIVFYQCVSYLEVEVDLTSDSK